MENENVERPIFNVSAPINCVLGVQMNLSFGDLLAQFIEDMHNNEGIIVESEIWAFRNAIRRPGRGKEARR